MNSGIIIPRAGKLEAVAATALNDGRVAHVNSIGLGAIEVFLVGKVLLALFRDLRVFDALHDKQPNHVLCEYVRGSFDSRAEARLLCTSTRKRKRKEERGRGDHLVLVDDFDDVLLEEAVVELGVDGGRPTQELELGIVLHGQQECERIAHVHRLELAVSVLWRTGGRTQSGLPLSVEVAGKLVAFELAVHPTCAL